MSFDNNMTSVESSPGTPSKRKYSPEDDLDDFSFESAHGTGSPHGTPKEERKRARMMNRMRRNKVMPPPPINFEQWGQMIDVNNSKPMTGKVHFEPLELNKNLDSTDTLSTRTSREGSENPVGGKKKKRTQKKSYKNRKSKRKIRSSKKKLRKSKKNKKNKTKHSKMR